MPLEKHIITLIDKIDGKNLKTFKKIVVDGKETKISIDPEGIQDGIRLYGDEIIDNFLFLIKKEENLDISVDDFKTLIKNSNINGGVESQTPSISSNSIKSIDYSSGLDVNQLTKNSILNLTPPVQKEVIQKSPIDTVPKGSEYLSALGKLYIENGKEQKEDVSLDKEIFLSNTEVVKNFVAELSYAERVSSKNMRDKYLKMESLNGFNDSGYRDLIASKLSLTSNNPTVILNEKRWFLEEELPLTIEQITNMKTYKQTYILSKELADFGFSFFATSYNIIKLRNEVYSDQVKIFNDYDEIKNYFKNTSKFVIFIKDPKQEEFNDYLLPLPISFNRYAIRVIEIPKDIIEATKRDVEVWNEFTKHN